MSDRTAIEWAANADGSPGASWNPIRARNRASDKVGWLCVHESEGCRNCYAERINTRLGTGVDFKAQNKAQVEIFLDEKTLLQPLRWKKPRTIFVCSMSDLFGSFVSNAFIDKVFAIAALCPQHTFVVLTKRSRRMREYFTQAEGRDGSLQFSTRANGTSIEREMRIREATAPYTAFLGRCDWPYSFPLPNVWLGVSAEDQKTADARIPDLLATPAAIRFVSLEPLLGPIDLRALSAGAEWLYDALCGGHWFLDTLGVSNSADGPDLSTLDWVIVGGESGPRARPMHPDWARSLRDQCAAAGVPFFFKQWGEWIAGEVFSIGTSLGHTRCQDGHEHGGKPTHWWGGEVSSGVISVRTGKSAAGRALDGAEHNARPPLAHQVIR